MKKSMTTYERAIQEGIEKGMEKGMEKVRIQTILNGFDHGISVDLLAKLHDFNIDQVKKILKDAGKL